MATGRSHSPTDGNVHGWAWFYFVNEQVYRYLNLRVPARLRHGAAIALPGADLCLADALERRICRRRLQRPGRAGCGRLMRRAGRTCCSWSGPRCRCCFSRFPTRQEYYVLPSLPPLILLVARVLGIQADGEGYESRLQRSGHRSNLNLGLAPQAGIGRAVGPDLAADQESQAAIRRVVATDFCRRPREPGC